MLAATAIMRLAETRCRSRSERVMSSTCPVRPDAPAADMSGHDRAKPAAPQLRHSRRRSRAVIGPLRAVHHKRGTCRFAGRSGQTSLLSGWLRIPVAVSTKRQHASRSAEAAGSLVQSRTNPARAGTVRAVAQTDTGRSQDGEALSVAGVPAARQVRAPATAEAKRRLPRRLRPASPSYVRSLGAPPATPPRRVPSETS